jgi:hypothetical protein
MATGDDALDEMIRRVRRLGAMPSEVAAEVAPLMLAEARRTAAAGTTPDGKPWAPRKKDGGRALEHAADALSSRVLPSATAQLVLRGPEVIHNRGTEDTPKRQILPDGGAGLPPTMAVAVREGAERVFRRIIGGG